MHNSLRHLVKRSLLKNKATQSSGSKDKVDCVFVCCFGCLCILTREVNGFCVFLLFFFCLLFAFFVLIFLFPFSLADEHPGKDEETNANDAQQTA